MVAVPRLGAFIAVGQGARILRPAEAVIEAMATEPLVGAAQPLVDVLGGFLNVLDVTVELPEDPIPERTIGYVVDELP